MKRIGMEGSFAIAEAVKLAHAEAIAAYPITPQTHIVERLAEFVANGELDAEYIPVESEHSAMSACLGTSAVGARTFTATASQGLELMHEVLYVASGLRLPVVMAVANRALSAPLSIWTDHSDVMATRDCGWIQIFAENAQQAFDLILCAFRIAEDPSVLLPTMVHIDGFYVSHTIEPVQFLEQEAVNKFLPEYRYPYPLDPDKPVTIGAFGPPFIYTEAKKAHENTLRGSEKVILQVWKEFGELSGRHYSPVEEYKTEDADVLLLCMGSFSETAMMAIDKMQAEGQKVGLISLRLWRPFPAEELRQAVSKAQVLVVLDRALSLGAAPPVCAEIQAALYPLKTRPKIVSFVGSLGGREISAQGFEDLIRHGVDKAKSGKLYDFEMIGVRE
ncbi:MAG: pyruvate ferredoxin oxidoreductase [Chloroflexi bacterium RBG_13_50_10]|nr:MAG: pyruvate ferredoxin oxidoreductase [Chloroflexi bacterium RBG_13_50_10]